MASKKILIIVPLPLLGNIDKYADNEQRTRSDIIREAMREYCKKHPLPTLAAVPDIAPETEAESPLEVVLEAVSQGIEAIQPSHPTEPSIVLSHPFFTHPINRGVKE